MSIMVSEACLVSPRATRLASGRGYAEICIGAMQPVGKELPDVRCDRLDAGEYKLGRWTSKEGFGFRRSWQNSRVDRSAATLIWFVRKGQMDVVYGGQRQRVTAGQCCFMLSSQAFYLEISPDADEGVDLLHLSAPSFKFHHALYDRVRMGVACHADRREVVLASETLALLFAGEELSASHAEKLIEVLLQGVVHSAELQFGQQQPLPSISEMRVAEITRCINRDFTNPDLSVKMVANQCGISERYVIMALKKKSISFSQLVWERRIEASTAWISDISMDHHSISLLAYRAGFKSAAHFSRMFKARHGMTPSDYRRRAYLTQRLDTEAA